MIAFFDFDGTLTLKDSLLDFIKYAVGKWEYYIGLLTLSPMLAAYKFGFINNHRAKEKFIAHYLKERDAVQFQKIADKYSLEQIDNIIRVKAMKKIAWHQEQNHKIVIVSASMECWLKKWCLKHNIELIATRLEIQKGKLTGKFATKNCFGKEKVNRIKECYELSEYSTIYAYGDSSGDKEMLEIADKKYYKYFA
jgi:HAD superfamily hydrolase (TIGR01490 family)|tara:strand:+ start:260 stop:844 length:585 start_codon:yes stop_codon:yes gene_type:complete